MKNTIKSAVAIGLALSLGMIASTHSQAMAQNALSPAKIEQQRSIAQQYFADGDLNAALKSIERLIIAKPTDIPARFFRAQLLASLGRGEEIINELKLMTTLKISAEDKQKARNLITAIERDGRAWDATITVKAGIGRTDNVNSWPKGGERTSGGKNFPLPDPVNDEFKAISDTLTEGGVGVRGSYNLNENNDFNILFGFSGNQIDGEDTVNADATTVAGNLGVEKVFSNGLKTRVDYARTNLNRVNDHKGETVNTDISVETMKFELGRTFGKNNAGGYIYSTSISDHKGTSTADLSDVTTETHSLYLGGLLGGMTFLRGTLSYAEGSSDIKNATVSNVNKAKDRVNKSTTGFTLIGVRVLPNAQRVIGSVTYKTATFDEQEVNTGVKRKDDSTIYSLGYSIKGQQLWSPLGDISLGLDMSYAKTNSNQDSSDITSKKYMFTITKKFKL